MNCANQAPAEIRPSVPNEVHGEVEQILNRVAALRDRMAGQLDPFCFSCPPAIEGKGLVPTLAWPSYWANLSGLLSQIREQLTAMTDILDRFAS